MQLMILELQNKQRRELEEQEKQKQKQSMGITKEQLSGYQEQLMILELQNKQRRKQRRELEKREKQKQSMEIATERRKTEDEILKSLDTSLPPTVRDGEGRDVSLSPAAARDLIQNHPLVRQGFVNAQNGNARLIGFFQADLSSPIYLEQDVISAVEASRRD